MDMSRGADGRPGMRQHVWHLLLLAEMRTLSGYRESRDFNRRMLAAALVLSISSTICVRSFTGLQGWQAVRMDMIRQLLYRFRLVLLCITDLSTFRDQTPK